MPVQDSYQVISRKYRPKNFDEVLGQTNLITVLKNAVSLKQVAHAYIFSGTRGTGKTTLARIFSKCLNCFARNENNEPCNACESCKEITGSQSVDVLEIDGASHRSIEDIRYINETVAFAPIKSKFKIFIIDEVHMLTKEAFNALLKTLEEPPSHIKFLFATTELHKIPDTILSRCQVLILKRLTTQQITSKLSGILTKLNVAFKDTSLIKIAERAEGSLRDAESLLDQALAFNANRLTDSTVSEALGIAQNSLISDIRQAVIDKNFDTMFCIANTVFQEGYQIHYFLEQIINHFKEILLEQAACNFSSPHYSEYQLLSILEFLGEASYRIKQTIFEKSFLEISFIQLIKIYHTPSIQDFSRSLKALEQEVLTETSRLSLVKETHKDSETPNIPIKNPKIKDTSSIKQKTVELRVSKIRENEKSPVTHEKAQPQKISAKTSPETSVITSEEKSPPSEQKTALSFEEKIYSDILMQFTAVEFNSTLIKE